MQEKMFIVKRSGKREQFNPVKIKNAVKAAFNSVGYSVDDDVYDEIVNSVKVWDEMTIEDIQDQVIETLRNLEYHEIADCYQTYRLEHKQARFIRERIDYMDKYANSSENASTSSETDANANVTMKNVANLEGEVYKVTNRRIQRQRMKDKLNELFPEDDDLGKQYIKDLESWIIYTHDEASSPVLKPYCMAASLYPLMAEGVGVIDGVTPSAPNDIQSFSGQVTNLTFLLSANAKGAIALGDYFIALNYYVIAEFGPDWYNKLDINITNENSLKPVTIKRAIRKGMKQFIYGVNQPAGNRSYNSPFSNVSYYDKTYFESIFDEFYYPDGTKPEWEAIDTLQRIFMELHRELRLVKPLTFPVTTMAMVHDGTDVIDKEYKQLCAEEWAKGGSFFCYLSNNPSALASCCRVLNEMQENTFSSTTGLTGIMTGSCNVITLNINRIVQDWRKNRYRLEFNGPLIVTDYSSLKDYFISILERVYKYHIAYKTMLYDLEEKGMFSPSNGGYIYMKKLYSTIGLIGYTEAAQFLGLKVSNNPEYIEFLRFIFGTVKEQNKEHSIRDKKRPILFNSEAIPGEGLGVKLYEHDKADGYWVPEDQNLYNCYFYNPWDNTSILDKFILHGKQVAPYCDGGQALHANLDEHLSKEQYLKLIDFAIEQGTNYFTFNIPISECKSCGHVVNAPIEKCPICGSKNIDYWTRIIGYLRPVSAFSVPRKIEQKKRVYGTNINGKGGYWIS
jgi:ribonucleoside-triphosphate reductase